MRERERKEQGEIPNEDGKERGRKGTEWKKDRSGR
jgi:hypothetical protein